MSRETSKPQISNENNDINYSTLPNLLKFLCTGAREQGIEQKNVTGRVCLWGGTRPYIETQQEIIFDE